MHMKKFSIIILVVLGALGAQAQNRKYTGNFSLFQQYFNPALTGYEGSVVKTFYRDQWTGYQDAPRTLFVSGELNLADLKSFGNRRPAGAHNAAGNDAVGLSILHDTFGPFKESQFNASYSYKVALSEMLSLRGGAALTYNLNSLDETRLVFDDISDAQYQYLLRSNNNRVHKLGVNAGLVLSATNYYFGYAVQDLTKGALAGGDPYLNDTYALQHVLQGGYRRGITDQFGLVFNGLYRYDSKLKSTLEGQLKGVYDDTYWAGIGYRNNLALTFTAGMRFKNQFKIGYLREMPSGKGSGVNVGSNELLFTYNLFPPAATPSFQKRKPSSIW